MRKLKYILALVGTVACGQASSAQGFDALADSILSGDPAVRAERARLLAEVEEMVGENRLENPELDFGYKWGQGSTDINKWDISVSQNFDWPGVYSARRKAIDSRRRAMDETVRALSRARGYELRSLMIDYVAARRRLALCEDFSRNVDSIYAVSSRAYELMQLTVLDYRKVCVERELARARCVEERTAMSTALKQIEAFGGGEIPGLSGLEEYPTVAPEFDVEASPSLGAARWNMLAAASEASAARRSLFPGFSLGYVHEVEGGEHFNGLSVGVSLPLWQGRKKAQAAKLLEEAAAEAMEASRREVVSEFNAALEERASLTAQADALEAALGDEDEYRRLLDKALAGGTLTLFQYFNELNTILDARMSIEQLRADAARASERLRRL